MFCLSTALPRNANAYVDVDDDVKAGCDRCRLFSNQASSAGSLSPGEMVRNQMQLSKKHIQAKAQSES